MRNPARIDGVIERLRALWKAHPDYRLAQLIGNAYPAHSTDPYNIEDDEFIEQLEVRNGFREGMVR